MYQDKQAEEEEGHQALVVAALPQALPEAPAGISPSHHLPSLSFPGTVIRRSCRILKKKKNFGRQQ
jgi:hypothetical protein